MTKRKKYILIFTAIPIVLVMAFIIWAGSSSQPMDEAVQVMEGTEQVIVDTEKWMTFTPEKGTAIKKGFIFYPGAKVEPEAYAPLAKEIAKQGVKVIIVPMPLNLAVFGSNEALQVIAHHKEIKEWVIGGHSLGGSMAARLVYKHSKQFDGLILWASYPAENNDLSDSSLPILSIYGELDGLATPEKIDQSQKLLPINTQWVKIEGGNHSQFGWYGFQQGDKEAEISRERQQEIIIRETVDFIRGI